MADRARGGRVTASSATVVLSGRAGGTTHRAVDVLDTLPQELRLIGGLAVLCRVGMPHRATVDLDAVTRDLAHHDATLRRLAVVAEGGGQYRFPGELELDVIEVAPVSAVELMAALATTAVTDLELNVVAHAWAHDASTPVDIAVLDDRGGVLATARGRMVASPMGLVAMKATTVPLRASARPEKRASDLYDLARLVVTCDVGPDELVDLPTELVAAVVERLTGWFVDDAGRDRTYRDIRRFDEPRVDLDDVADRVMDLVGRLERYGADR
jgi:hypothetical protein